MNTIVLSRFLAAAVTFIACLASTADACTRCVYLGKNGTVIAARSMDWDEDPGTNLYCFPRGLKRDGASGKNSIHWISKYGSVVGAFYEVGTVDGMNEKGLVANTLYLVESDYGKPDGKKPTLTIAAWAQYVLDNFATVEEAVKTLRTEPFVIIAPLLPNKLPAQGHLSLSDPSGDSAIFEYVKGSLVIHHGTQYQVMTNSPTFDEQLALNKYWKQIGGQAMLPGTNRAADRFVRASFCIDAIPKTEDRKKAIASVFSVIRSVSVPLGMSTPNQPNIAGTIWRTLHDHKDKVVYFDSAVSPTVFWVPLADMDFTEGVAVRKLELVGDNTYSGNAARHFKESRPFQFLQAHDK